MHKPSFGVVTGVITCLAVVAFFSKLLVPLVPEGPQNRLAYEPSPFLQQAGTQQIDWRRLGEDTFAEARKRDLPVMLVVGSACSATGRMADRVTFQTKEIQNYLDRNFICARVDSMDYPEFVNAFLPLSRAVARDGWRIGIPPDFQVWFLDPKGRLFAFAAETAIGRPLDPRGFHAALEDALDRYEQIHDGKLEAGALQRLDLAALSTPLEPRIPDVGRYGAFLSQSIHEVFGGLPVNGYQRLWPAAWKFQLLTGRLSDYRASVEPCLRSPRFDLLDGGFFTSPSPIGWMGGGYDKLTLLNAEMMGTLALGAVLMEDPQHRWLALRTFDSLTGEFKSRGLIAAGRVGDSDALGRSSRSSFSPRILREIFPAPSDREWLRTRLGLRIEDNPQMTPRLVSLDLPSEEPERFAQVLDVLRAKSEAKTFAGFLQADVSGIAIARLIEAARLLDDEGRLRRVLALYPALEDFRSLNDIVHSLMSDREPHAYFGDYLAFADASLQYYLATGDADALGHGAAVLRRGLFLFGGRHRGVYTLSQPDVSSLAPQDIASPEIVDNQGESCSARAMRLCADFGRLLGDSGEDLALAAQDILWRFAPIAPALGPYAGGYFASAARLLNPAFVLVAGPDSVAQATRLSRLCPGILIAPAIGPVKVPSTETQHPGVYIVRGTSVEGPLTIDRASGRLQRLQ